MSSGRAPRGRTTPQVTAPLEVLVFLLEGDRYAIPIEVIDRVIAADEILPPEGEGGAPEPVDAAGWLGLAPPPGSGEGGAGTAAHPGTGTPPDDRRGSAHKSAHTATGPQKATASADDLSASAHWRAPTGPGPQNATPPAGGVGSGAEGGEASGAECGGKLGVESREASGAQDGGGSRAEGGAGERVASRRGARISVEPERAAAGRQLVLRSGLDPRILRVGAVLGVRTIDRDRLEPPPIRYPERTAARVLGIERAEEGMIVVLALGDRREARSSSGGGADGAPASSGR